jgi:hypothetical protein
LPKEKLETKEYLNPCVMADRCVVGKYIFFSLVGVLMNSVGVTLQVRTSYRNTLLRQCYSGGNTCKKNYYGGGNILGLTKLSQKIIEYVDSLCWFIKEMKHFVHYVEKEILGCTTLGPALDGAFGY